ncbi:MAG: winged helix-turn-helix domain-containing protein [Armatimonadota bacterium]|nr:winged helix-turn-helix domain-containing protein [Armatimonadota bacterium]
MPWTRRALLLAEAEEDRTRLLRQHLEAANFRVILATDGQVALDRFRAEAPAAAIVDVQLPAQEDFELLRLLRRESDIPIIVWSRREAEVDKLMAFAIGADAYLPKSASPREIVMRLRALLRRASSQPPARRTLLVHGRIALDRDRQQVTVDGRPISLTPAEYRLLEALLERPGRVWTREALLARLHVGGKYPDRRSIDFHLARLRKKIERDPHRPEHLRTVRGFGVIMQDASSAGGHLASQVDWLVRLFAPALYPVVVVHPNGVIRMMNPAAERLVGRSASDIVGRMTCHDTFGCEAVGLPGRCTSSRCGLRERLTPSAPVRTGKIRLGIPRGGRRPVQVTHILLPAPSGGPEQVLIIFEVDRRARRSTGVGQRSDPASVKPV